MIFTKIKICGITNLDDAVTAAELGADLLGFIFYPKSPRYIDPQKARDIIAKIPTFVDTVAVFVNPTLQQVQETAQQGWFNWIQLHGDETPDFCRSLHWLNIKLIKAVRVKDRSDIDKALTYPTDAVLLDTYTDGLYGGTGQTFDWSLIGYPPRRIFLSGGIGPHNIRQALEVGTYGIDINSGVESAPGKKDPAKLKQLFDSISRIHGGKVHI
ncbi:MAG TPA: phosphoribosylanthranilate isomerase [Anaerohalosphaeraceae bacterium]|nr:phosphoribosylanthranilate isomerase [Anaerohalosphaeraceae bacterium]